MANLLPITENHKQISKDLVFALYKDEAGKPIVLTDGQAEIFSIIFFRLNPRNHVMTTTQYGKSLVIGLAVLTRACCNPEPWCIVSGNTDKAHIIMDYVIQHIFDNPWTQGKFVQEEKASSSDSIRQYRNKSRLSFKVSGKGPSALYSEIFLTTAKGAIGHGSQNIVVDESSLVPDKEFAFIMRMLGGYNDNFLVEVGNPFLRNHFMRASRNARYYKVVITWEQAVREGRLTEDFIEEMRNQAFFGVLYEVKFPTAESIDSGGYMPLITEEKLDHIKDKEFEMFGELRMGVDVSGGGANYSDITIRGKNGAKIVWKHTTNDTLVLIPQIEKFCRQYGIPIDDDHIFIDKVGIGKGLCDRMNELYPHKAGFETNDFGINFGSEPFGKIRNNPLLAAQKDPPYVNLRAQAYWLCGEALNAGLMLGSAIEPDPNHGELKADWDQFLDIKYKVQSDKKIKFKSKKEMADDGIESPDDADSLALTFAKKEADAVVDWKQDDYIHSSGYGL